MKKRNESYKPTAIEMKILMTVYLLNLENYFPLNDGVVKIIKGVVDVETSKFMNYPTFSTIKSYSSKKISRHISALIKHRYLTKRYYPKNKESYLAITNLGFNVVKEYENNHKNSFKKVEQSVPETIVKIED